MGVIKIQDGHELDRSPGQSEGDHGLPGDLCLADCGEENRMRRVQGERSKEERADVRPEMAQC